MRAAVKAERVQVDYVHWKCFLHSPARTWEDVTWVAREGYFSKCRARKLASASRSATSRLRSTTARTSTDGSDETDPQKDAEAKATVYEIWCRKSQKVYFIAKGCDEPLEESNRSSISPSFWPCPRPLFAT